MKLKLNLEYLRTFAAVVRYGGINAAAEHLYLTQPAVSVRIKNLEEALATQLFSREGENIRLTKQGELLLGYTDQFLRLANLVERDLVSNEGVEARLRIGASETIVQSWLPRFISKINDRFPNLDIEIIVDISIALQKCLLSRPCKIATV